MTEKDNLLMETKLIIRSILLSCSTIITPSQLCMDYRDLIGKELPYREFGYETVLEFLRNISDIIRFEWIPSLNDFGLSVISDESTVHIEKMVKQQKKAKKHIRMVRHNPLWSSFKNRYSSSRNKSFRSAKMISKNHYSNKKSINNQSNELNDWNICKIKNQIQELLCSYKNGLYLKDFMSIFKTYFNEDFPLRKFEYHTLKEYLMCIPDIVSVEYDGRDDVVRLNSDQYLFGNVTNRENNNNESRIRLKPVMASQNGTKSNNNSKNLEDDTPEMSCNCDDDSNRFETLDRKLFIDSLNIDETIKEHATQQSQEESVEKKSMLKKESSSLNDLIFSISKMRCSQKSKFRSSSTLSDSTVHNKRESNLKNSNEIEMKNSLANYTKLFDKKSELSGNISTDKKKKIATDELTNNENLCKREFQKVECQNKIEISDELKQIFRRVLSFHSNGILSSNFLHEYSKVTREDLNLSEYGFNSVLELVLSLPEVFKIDSDNSNENDCVLFVSDNIIRSDDDRLNSIYPCINNFHFNDTLISNVINIMDSFKKFPLEDFECKYRNTFNVEFPWADLGFCSFEAAIIELCDIIPIELTFEGVALFISLNSKAYESNENNTLFKFSGEIPSDSVLPGETYIPQQLPKNLNHYILVYVSDIDNPEQFWIQIKGKTTTTALEILMKNLQKIYESQESDKYKMPDDLIGLNNVCVALWPDNNTWHRGLITGIPCNDYVEILYVDYGTKCTTPKQFLRLLKREFFTLPSQAIKAKLENIQPVNGTQWCEEANERFIELCADKLLIAFVIDIHVKDRISISLSDVSGNNNIHISNVLINEHLAIQAFDSKNPKSEQNEGLASCLSSSSCSVLEVRSDPPSIDIFEENEEFYDHLCKAIEYDFNVTKIFLEGKYEIHIIILNQKMFVSSEDIASLFQKSDLEKILSARKIFIPYIIIKKSDDEKLFVELTKYNVKGIKDSSNSVVIYPFENVIDILNALDHPSQDLKNDVKLEMKYFLISNLDTMEIPLDELKAAVYFENKKREKIFLKMLEDGVNDDYVKEVQRIENRLKLFIMKTKKCKRK